MGSREGAKGKGGNVKSAGGGGGATVAEQAKVANQPQFTGHLNLTKMQQQSLRAYQEGSSGHINLAHRGLTTVPLTGSHLRISENLDVAIHHSRINHPTLIRRAFLMPPGSATLRAGMTFDDGGFGSFSVKGEVTRRFLGRTVAGQGNQYYVLRVRAAPGTKALYVQGVPGASPHYTTGVTAEHEVLRPRGSAYKIRRARKVKSGPHKGAIVLDADIIA